MRIFLRFVAGYTFLVTLFTALLVVQLSEGGAITALLKSGTFGVLTLAGWLITLVAGIPAAILLWRLSNVGRMTSAVVLGSIGLYYFVCLSFFRTPQTHYSYVLAGMLLCGVVTAILCSPVARRACR